jgi:hypothetical protein
MRVRRAAIGCEILAGIAQPVIYGVTVISSGIGKRRSAMGVSKTMRVELTGSGQLNTHPTGAAEVGQKIVRLHGD